MAELPKKKIRPWDKPRKAQEGRKAGSTAYQNRTWRKCSENYRKSKPICEVSEAAGFIFPSDVTDHIIPLKEGGAMYDIRNLMAMCHARHNRKSGMESHKGILIEWKLNHEGDKIPVNRNDIIKLLNND